MTRIIVTAFLTFGFLSSVGCNKTESGGSQPGTDNSFKLSGPDTSTSMKPGETKKVKIGIDPGKSFNDAVNLEVTDKPKGLKAEVDKSEPAGAKEAHLTVTADKDAASGNYVIKVSGKASKGGPSTSNLEIKITVDKP